VLEDVIGCTVDRLRLDRANNYDVDLDKLRTALRDNYDLVVLVNPNSPTGRHINAAKLKSLLREAPTRTRIWIDETDVEYAGSSQSLEQFAATSENVVVCKSMSKVYALSGMRAAYLCASPHQLEELRAITPPWVIGLPAQVAAVAALNSPAYYEQRYAETHHFRDEMKRALENLGLDIVPGRTNCLLAHLNADGPIASRVVAACRERGLFIRDAKLMGVKIGERAIRIAVKDPETNQKILQILASVLDQTIRIERGITSQS
jgi:histidinol-phosphate/aromatic aminotransferase/cobyric acid decarboxylase-like protein